MIQHGTPSAYFNGCTCAPCKVAGKAYRSEGTHEAYQRGDTRKPPLFTAGDRTTAFDSSDPRHGSISAYTMGCRCPLCRRAGQAYREYRKLGLKLPKGWNARNEELTNAKA